MLQGCALSVPPGISPVTDFDISRYLGRWYEIARLDNRFQRGLVQVTATYGLRRDGGISVENTGWHVQRKRKRTIVGKASFVADRQVGHLKLSFWGFLYSSYVIFYLETDYSVAIVCGSSRNCCWILSRNQRLSAEELAKYLKIAEEKGVAIEQFIYTSDVIPADMDSLNQ